VPVITPEYKVLLDPATPPSTGVQYIGLAQPNTSVAEDTWAIMRLTFDSDDLAAVEWASGTNQFVKVWNDRAGYTYS